MTDSTADINAWNRNADQYAQLIGNADDRIYALFKDVLWDTLGDVRGLRVLDAGCGHGWLTHALAVAGAHAIGVDGSAALLNKARQLSPQTEFVEWDLATGLPLLEPGFDRILAHMVLMDLPAIGPLLQAVRRALNPGGKFIFTLTHPCYYNYKSHRDPATNEMYCRVTGYLQAEVWQIASFGGHSHYHRSLTDYFDGLRLNGLAVTRLYEPPQIPYTEAMDDFRHRIPKFILIEAVPV